MNNVVLVGNLTKDPELSTTPNGVSVCRFGIAVQRDYANADGDKITDFFNVTVWRAQAEHCAKYLSKGKKVGVIGRLENRSYEDKDGVKRYVTDIVAESVEFLSPRDKTAPAGADQYDKPVSAERKAAGGEKEGPQLEEINDNKLPF